MSEEGEPRQRGRVWKWIRRVIVWLFLLQTVLIVAVLIYAAYWNRRGPRDLADAIRRCQDRALLEDRQAAYQRAAGENRLGAYYTAAFFLSPSGRDENGDLPYIGVLGSEPRLGKPLDAKLLARLRAFPEANREYFRLLDAALDAGAKAPLIGFESLDSPQLRSLGGSTHAARSYLLLSLLAQGEGKADEALRMCGRALSVNRIFDAQPLVITGLMRSGNASLAREGIESGLSRVGASSAVLGDLRRMLLAEDARIDLREACAGDVSLAVEAARDPDLLKGAQTYGASQAAGIIEETGRKWRTTVGRLGAGVPESPLEEVSRSKVRFLLGVSWTWHWLCPGATEWWLAGNIDRARESCDLLAGSPTDLARWAKPLADTGNQKESGSRTETDGQAGVRMLARTVQVLLEGKAALHVSAAALAVEQYRLQNGRWPEKLADVPGPVPSDLFAGDPLKYVRTDDGCMIYSVGKNLTDDGGIGYDQDGDDIVFRLFDADGRNRP
ncbi:MAG TPA: hypothetical protein VM389_06400 [Phycisphaerae bacterium]|nr:hypothetical protein [Phycisphaerae bacterium]